MARADTQVCPYDWYPRMETKVQEWDCFSKVSRFVSFCPVVAPTPGLVPGVTGHCPLDRADTQVCPYDGE